MIKPYTLALVLLYCTTFSYNRVLGQNNTADSAQLRQTTASMSALFISSVGEQSRLYNGPSYVGYGFASKTNANFNDTTAFGIGAVKYDGMAYTNVPLKFDMYSDILISRVSRGELAYCLVAEKVTSFDLFRHHFIMLGADSVGKDMDPGYYDALYDKKIRLVARRTKFLQQISAIEQTFVKKNVYYLKKGNTWYNVNSQSKFLDALKDKQKELKQYLKDNKINFSDNPEEAMTMLAAYYDHLTK